MKNSFIILACFLAGVTASYFRWLPEWTNQHDYSLYILYIMMFFVGIGLGFDIKSLIRPWKKYKAKILLIPLATIAGTVLFSGAVSIVLPHTDLRETIAIGSGFGYYSLSAIFLDKLAGSDIGMMALISNLARELLALLTIPFLARFCGKLAPISAAGATSLDTTLPVIASSVGEDFVIVSVFHGIIVDFSVPVIISMLYWQ